MKDWEMVINMITMIILFNIILDVQMNIEEFIEGIRK